MGWHALKVLSRPISNTLDADLRIVALNLLLLDTDSLPQYQRRRRPHCAGLFTATDLAAFLGLSVCRVRCERGGQANNSGHSRAHLFVRMI